MKKILLFSGLIALTAACFAHEQDLNWWPVATDREIWESANNNDNYHITHHVEGSPVDSLVRTYDMQNCDGQSHMFKHKNQQAPGWIAYWLYCHSSEPSQYIFAHWNKDKWELIVGLPKDTTTTAVAKGIPIEFWNIKESGSSVLECRDCDFHGKFMKDVPPIRYKSIEKNLSYLKAEKVKGFDGLNKIFKKVKEERIKYIITDKQDKDGEFFYQVIYRTEKIETVKIEIPY